MNNSAASLFHFLNGVTQREQRNDAAGLHSPIIGTIIRVVVILGQQKPSMRV